ncbi:MAG: methyltransferase domain-containing protein [Nitrospirae bacterium]|nr:methyltransferase domain-containing protein [Nitrospirota bacterium]
MHWKLKAAIQNTVSLLPSSAGYAVYYWIQRHFGGLRQMNPVGGLSAGIEIWKRIDRHGSDPVGKVFLEVGTGRAPITPLSYWLMGADRTITIDLNPYLRAELVRESLQYIADHDGEVRRLFGDFLEARRLDELLGFHRKYPFTVGAFLDLCRIDYVAPGDAAQTHLAERSIDFHTSYTVLEHIPPQTVRRILAEGIRIVAKGGLFIHKIDYSDHFSHSDRTILPVNFLQYSDAEWERYAGNRYMYMNRLRHDDYISLFQDAGHSLLAAECEVCPRSRESITSGRLRLDGRFYGKSEETLATIGSWIVSRKGE